MNYAKILGLDTSNSGSAHLIRKAGLSHDGGSEGKVLERKVCRKADGGGVSASYKRGGKVHRKAHGGGVDGGSDRARLEAGTSGLDLAGGNVPPGGGGAAPTSSGDKDVGDALSDLGNQIVDTWGWKKGGKVHKKAVGGGVAADYKRGGKVCRKADGGGVAAEYKRGGPTRKSKNKDIRYLERDERYDVKTHRGKNAHHAVEDIIHDMKPLHKAAGGAAKKRLYGI